MNYNIINERMQSQNNQMIQNANNYNNNNMNIFNPNYQILNMNNQNNINNYYNNNIIMNFQRKSHKPEKDASIICLIEKEPSTIDKNEINIIKNIIQIQYTSYFQKKKILSDSIAEEIKKKLQGEWFVFASNAEDNLYFRISTVDKNNFLIIKIGNSRFHIARIK